MSCMSPNLPPISEAWRYDWALPIVPHSNVWPWVRPKIKPIADASRWRELQSSWDTTTSKVATSLLLHGVALLPSRPGVFRDQGEWVEAQENLRFNVRRAMNNGLSVKGGNGRERVRLEQPEPTASSFSPAFWDAPSFGVAARAWWEAGFIGVLTHGGAPLSGLVLSLPNVNVKKPVPWPGRRGIWMTEIWISEPHQERHLETYISCLDALFPVLERYEGRIR